MRLDLVGLGLVALVAAWVGAFAGDGAGRPQPVILLLVGMVAATATGRALSVHRGLVPAVLAVGISGSLVLTWPGVLGAGGAPLGYANGNAALASLGLVAALSAARAERDPGIRRGWIGLAVLLGGFTVATGSVAGVLALAVALGLLGVGAATRWAALAVVGSLIAVSLAVGVTTAVALGSDVGDLRERAAVRGELWTAAADFARDEPVVGIGPGQFADQNPVSADADLRWAHHGYLQAAAELGLVGLVLLAAIVGWVWIALWHATRDEPATACLAAAAVTLVALHAAVDYVWHLPPVLLITCALLGTGTAAPQGCAPEQWSLR